MVAETVPLDNATFVQCCDFTLVTHLDSWRHSIVFNMGSLPKRASLHHSPQIHGPLRALKVAGNSPSACILSAQPAQDSLDGAAWR